MRRILTKCLMIFFLFKVSIPAVENVLIVQSRDDYFSTVSNQLESELSGSFNIVKLKKIRDTNEIAEIIPSLAPKAIIILEKHSKGSSLYWFREYLQSHPSKFSSTAFIFVKDFFGNQSEIYMDNATGISFLPPISLGVEKLQEKIHKEIRSVGIIHPLSLRKMIIDNSSSCVLKGISLAMKTVPDRNDPSFSKAVADALNNMKKQNVDALWIVEDESLLQLKLVQDVLGPFLKKNDLPAIVNNDALTTAPWDLGTVSIIPEPQQLSSQIAKKIRELKQNSWVVYSPSIDPLDIYSKYLKKTSLPRSKVVMISQDHQIETPTHTAPRQDSAVPAIQQTQLASVKTSDSTLSNKPSPVTSVGYNMPTNIQKNPNVNQEQKVITNVNTVATSQDLSSQKTKKTNSEQKQIRDRVLPKPPEKTAKENHIQSASHEKAVTETQEQPDVAEKTVEQNSVQPLPAGKILKYILITTSHAAVRESPDTTSLVVGWALKDQQFPVFDEKGDNLQISFFNSYGWITSKDVKTVDEITTSTDNKQSSKTQKHLLPIIFIILNVLFAATLITVLITRRPSSRSAKQASKKR